jgi:hypothetical protein
MKPLRLTAKQKQQVRLAHLCATRVREEVTTREFDLDPKGRERMDTLRTAINALEMFILAEPR